MIATRATLDVFVEVLSRFNFRWGSERDLQDALAEAFATAGIAARREHTLDRESRPDFYLPEARIAVEVKVRSSRAALIRQAHRYACHLDVEGVLLVTPSLRLDLPPTMNGKPCAVCRIPRFA